jgi:putative ATPase
VHKSLRGSDPDAALFWWARMVGAGEDMKYLLRRLTRFATEDIGLADPQALIQAISAWNSYERLGSPEGDLAVAALVVYLATAPKSIGVYKAWGRVKQVARETASEMPPKHILNAPTKLMKQLGYSDNYQYDPETKDGFSGQNYFPDGMKRQVFYEPFERGFEREIKKRLDYWNDLRKKKK